MHEQKCVKTYSITMLHAILKAKLKNLTILLIVLNLLKIGQNHVSSFDVKVA